MKGVQEERECVWYSHVIITSTEAGTRDPGHSLPLQSLHHDVCRTCGRCWVMNILRAIHYHLNASPLDYVTLVHHLTGEEEVLPAAAPVPL